MSDKTLAYDTMYHSEVNQDTTWETCSLRKWLNKDFYDSSFTLEEKALIVESKIINNDNPWYGTKGGRDAVDKLFLLSVEEVV